MSDIKLFDLRDGRVTELTGQSVAVEKSLQTLIEHHLEEFLGVQFLASEYSTGKTHGGRIDTLGIDENGFPVIIEYKRALNENVMNQGLFYLNWLLDHKGEFELMVLKHLGQEAASSIEWSNPRLLCIAGDFTKYDELAVKEINRNIELIRYRRYGDSLLLLELVNTVTQEASAHDNTTPTPSPTSRTKPATKTVSQFLDQAQPTLQDLFHAADAFILALGDDVQRKTLKNYFAYKRIKNFACVEVHPQTHTVLVYVKVDADTVDLEEGFTRDVRTVGHFGTGDLEIRIHTPEEFEEAKSLILSSYETS